MPPKKTSVSLVVAVLGLVLSPASLFAQASPYSPDQTASEADETVILPAFTVSSETVDRYRAADAVSAVRIRTSLIETPSTISVLTREFIEDVAPTRLVDAMGYTASVQTGAGMAFTDFLTIRGFQVTAKTLDNFAYATNGPIDDTIIERLEISKGPNAILAPGGSPGGHINIVTKAPKFDKASASITGIWGEWDADKYSIDINQPLDAAGRFAYRVVAAYQDTHRYWSKDQPRERRIFAPSFTWRISPTTELTLRYNYAHTLEMRDPLMVLDSSVVQRGQKPILAPGFSPRSLNGIPPSSILGEGAGRASAQLTTSFNKHITMRAGLSAYRTGIKSDQIRPAFPALNIRRYNPYTGIQTPDQTWALQDSSQPHNEVLNRYVPTNSPYINPTAIPIRGDRVEDGVLKTLIAQNDWVFTYDTPWAKLQTVAGWQYSRDEGTDKRYDGTIAPYNIYDLENQDLSVTWATTPSRDNTSDYRNTQIYINQRIGLWEDRILLTGGYLFYDIDNRLKSPIGGDSTLDDSQDMYMGGVLFRVTPQASVYYSYSGNANPVTVNFDQLWSEGKQHEYGVKTEFFNRRLSINFAYFEIEQSNIRLPNPDYLGGDLTAPRDLATAYKNHGVEFEVYGSITKDLSVLASFSQMKMRDPMGRNVRFVSDKSAAAMLNYRFPEGTILKGLAANVGVVYNDEYAGDLPSVSVTPLGIVAQPSFFIPSQTLWKAGASYSWSRYLVRVYVDNVAGKKDYVQQGGSRFNVFTAPGRLVRVSATVKF